MTPRSSFPREREPRDGVLAGGETLDCFRSYLETAGDTAFPSPPLGAERVG
jgi:hypothetical protein